MSVATIKIKAEGTRGPVILNGVDVSLMVTTYEIMAQAGEIPVVKLGFLADVEFEGDEETAVSQLAPDETLTIKVGTDGRLHLTNSTEIKLTVDQPAVFVRRR